MEDLAKKHEQTIEVHEVGFNVAHALLRANRDGKDATSIILGRLGPDVYFEIIKQLIKATEIRDEALTRMDHNTMRLEKQLAEVNSAFLKATARIQELQIEIKNLRKHLPKIPSVKAPEETAPEVEGTLLDKTILELLKFVKVEGQQLYRYSNRIRKYITEMTDAEKINIASHLVTLNKDKQNSPKYFQAVEDFLNPLTGKLLTPYLTRKVKSDE